MNTMGHWQGPPPVDQQDKLRFEIELEFVQCLSNPNYLLFLAQRDFFKQPAFVNYLRYLLYWKRQEYVKFLKYPQCLTFLELLQNEQFREAMSSAQNAQFIDDQLVLQWQHYVRRRMRLLQLGLQGEQQPPDIVTQAEVNGQ